MLQNAINAPGPGGRSDASDVGLDGKRAEGHSLSDKKESSPVVSGSA